MPSFSSLMSLDLHRILHPVKDESGVRSFAVKWDLIHNHHGEEENHDNEKRCN